MVWHLVGYGLVSGLCMRCRRPLAPMVSAARVPFCSAGSLALDIRRALPIPGLTGLPSDRIVLAIVWLRQRLSGSAHAATSGAGGCPGARQLSPRAMITQATRAALSANATATNFFGFLATRPRRQGSAVAGLRWAA